MVLLLTGRVLGGPSYLSKFQGFVAVVLSSAESRSPGL